MLTLSKTCWKVALFMSINNNNGNYQDKLKIETDKQALGL